MSTQTTPASTPAPARSRDGSGLNFGRVLHSEWIKVTTVPSTVILLTITLVVMVGLAALFAWQLIVSLQFMADSPPELQAQLGGVQELRDTAISTPGIGYIFGQLLIASLAVVLIASEWGTGMIRSTMVAVPKRIPALLAKNLVIALVAFLIGAGAALISYFVIQPILAPEDLGFALTDDGVAQTILGTGIYLALTAVISMAIGTLLRNTAGGVVTAIGLFFVLPVIVVNLIQGLADWIPKAARFLPSNAGDRLFVTEAVEGQLTALEGGLVMAAWALALLVISLVVAKRRDV
ncbi:ABC transporter permease [Arthrobacter sp. zg-ZUI100]|uniref:ABC transporter permease n=1 Tax=Arthrobacter jiangjiafuii TaxID=2817475 RepID=A0A975M5L4_9MICC|nr:ABC transporter permease subunit [Arthrobacter jiangjiafuii]MBP3035636.1 ABC transporter permease [Arthrobacter jiangjiafuii]MBP3042169.1 ABC transporter permease [Arthrobacter jiangjiafuii]QWC10059.1 ABC transporter permease [Arthrobacter jiangjiafuii]